MPASVGEAVVEGQPSATVLVVEDDPNIRELLVDTLSAAGYRVELAADAITGRERLEAGGIDLLLLDRMLGRVEGLELCRWVRARENTGYLPILVLTALGSPAQRHEGFAAGADDYVTKPFHLEELLDRVEVWVQTGRRLRAGEAASHDRARLEGVLLAARTMEDRLRNHLAVTMGYVELIADDPELPPHLRAPADKALQGAADIERVLERLQNLRDLVETEYGAHVGSTIELPRTPHE